MTNSLLVTASLARITGNIFKIPNNQDKNKQPRIVDVGVYFASYDSVCDEDSKFQKIIKATVI